jgi:hypothetical protein
MPRTPNYQVGESDFRSIEMYAMHEAFARERIAQMREQRSHRRRAAGEMAAASRWHRIEIRARAARQRHAAQAERASAEWAMASAQRR